MVNMNRERRTVKEEAVTLENQSAFQQRTHNESIVSSAQLFVNGMLSVA